MTIEAALENVPFLILDGAMATEMERRGYTIQDDLWSAVALYRFPEVVREIHLSYLRAGADIITTASYQATRDGFMKKGFSQEEADGLMRKSVIIAKEARRQFLSEIQSPRPIWVAASMGPYGAYLADGSEYRGQYGKSRAELAEFHEKRLDILLEEKPDLLAFETVPCLLEAEAIGDILQKRPDSWAWISFSCQDGERTCGGDWIRDCAAVLNDLPCVKAIGVNCTNPLCVESLIQEIRKETEKPVVVYPNSGEIFDTEKREWTGSPVDFFAYGKRWEKAGARIIGGCCRTGPVQIRKLKEVARKCSG